MHFSVLNFQQLTREKDMTPKYFFLEEYIAILYHLPNLNVNIENI